MKDKRTQLISVVCSIIFISFIFTSIPITEPIKPTLIFIQEVSQISDIYHVFRLSFSLISLSIGYTFAYGVIGWLLCNLFPLGSSLDFLQAWDILPLLLPLLELSENTLLHLAKIFGRRKFLSWTFLIRWFNGVHYIAFWVSIFLILCSLIYSSSLQLFNVEESDISAVVSRRIRLLEKENIRLKTEKLKKRKDFAFHLDKLVQFYNNFSQDENEIENNADTTVKKKEQ